MRKYITIISAALFLAVLAGCTLQTSSDSDLEAGSCWVVDPDGGQVLKIASGNNEITASNDIDVGRPISVVHNPYNDYTWVGDGDGRVMLLTARATLNRTIYGFDEPEYMALFPKEGAVWILDTGSDRVIKMAHRGTLELQLDGYPDGRGIAVDPVSGDVFVAQADKITRLNYLGDKLDTFDGFTDIGDIEYDGGIERLWVIDSGTGTFIRMKNDGTEVKTVANQIHDPRDIAINPINHYIYVAGVQANGQWIVGMYKPASDGVPKDQSWSYTGVKKMREDSEGDEDDFFGPVTLAVGQDESAIWINDYTNHRIIKAIDDGQDAILANIMGGFFAPSEIATVTKARR